MPNNELEAVPRGVGSQPKAGEKRKEKGKCLE